MGSNRKYSAGWETAFGSKSRSPKNKTRSPKKTATAKKLTKKPQRKKLGAAK
jgi:hypothetical protein